MTLKSSQLDRFARRVRLFTVSSTVTETPNYRNTARPTPDMYSSRGQGLIFWQLFLETLGKRAEVVDRLIHQLVGYRLMVAQQSLTEVNLMD